MTSNRSSGLDFSDRGDHPDLVIDPNGPSHLQRNKTERRRLQGLMRPDLHPIHNGTNNGPPTIRAKLDHWMVNEGGRRLFFGVWILLQLLVALFGFFNYRFKDNLDNARRTFGITYRECCARTCVVVPDVL